jgi:zinc/manganese transport system permease protein
MLAHEFMRNAYLAGTFVALACGLAGYFVVLRSQVFAGDALSHVAFTGALAAAAAGIDIRLGLFAATIAVAVGIGLLGERARSDDVVIGSVFAWVLGLGALFLSIFVSGSSGADGTAAVRVLFGSILGLSAGEARLAAVVAIGAVLALLAISRPLLLGSLDPDVARGLGLPLAALGLGFFVLLAVVAAEATQAVGALLLLGLLAAPGGAARLLTDDPWHGLLVSAGLALASMWAGLALSYAVPSLPPSFAVIAIATAFFAGAALRSRLRRGGPRNGPSRAPATVSRIEI